MREMGRDYFYNFLNRFVEIFSSLVIHCDDSTSYPKEDGTLYFTIGAHLNPGEVKRGYMMPGVTSDAKLIREKCELAHVFFFEYSCDPSLVLHLDA